MAILVLAATWSEAHAQDLDAASKHFAAAQDASTKRHHRRAAAEYQAAFDITKDALLLPKIGEAWFAGGDAKRAERSYRAYLKEQPTGPAAADSQRRIDELAALKTALADQSAPGDAPLSAVDAIEPQTSAPLADAQPPVPTTTSPAPTATAAPTEAAPAPSPAPTLGIMDDKPMSKMRVAAWITVAATVAALTAGGIFGLAAQSRGDEITRRFLFVDSAGQPRPYDETAKKDFDNLTSEGKLYNGLAIGFFSAAGALAITTTTLFIVDYKKGSAAKKASAFQITPDLGPGRAAITAGWKF